MQHNGNGTREDLVLYRIETAKSDINSAIFLPRVFGKTSVLI